MLAEFSIHLVRGTRELNLDIALMKHTLGEAGLHFELGRLSTTIEGDWEAVLQAIHDCHVKMIAAHDRVVTTITIKECKSGHLRPCDTDDSVEQPLAAQERAATE